ncbi:MAG: SDR family oxidoreductase [Bacteroidetes bacterium]|nr:MAG: SDR family oxidoreductase [Bacteroidota bacterium]
MKALVTGGTKGIGKAIVEKLLQLGHDVFFVARTPQDIKEVTSQWKQQYPNRQVIGFSADLTQNSSIENIFRATEEVNFHPEIIVNNAGVYIPDNIDRIEKNIFQTTMALNLQAPVFLTQLYLPRLKQHKKGFIINICSVLSKSYRLEAASYTISKHAFYTYSKMLAQQLRDYRIKVTSLLPGSVYTASWEETEVNSRTLVQPGDIAQAVELALNLSENTFLDEIIIQPTDKNY